MLEFENDVKMYGTQTNKHEAVRQRRFENDVKMYGTQTQHTYNHSCLPFENDVKMYGTQTKIQINNRNTLFENDVVIAVLNENGHTGRVQICPFLHLCCSRHARGETPYTFLKAREKWRAFS